MLSLIDITKKYKDKVIFQNANFEAEIGRNSITYGPIRNWKIHFS